VLSCESDGDGHGMICAKFLTAWAEGDVLFLGEAVCLYACTPSLFDTLVVVGRHTDAVVLGLLQPAAVSADQTSASIEPVPGSVRRDATCYCCCSTVY
jgi:hypothetical protein